MGAVPDPELEIERGGGGPKNFFQPSAWSKNKGGLGPSPGTPTGEYKVHTHSKQCLHITRVGKNKRK